jgi:selenocysteine-specific elongation factor
LRKHFIVGSAGHVDHGKTTLIKALTGIDTDRLPEEKARGLSIDLGFAQLALPGDLVLGIVDVPGHERFLKNMLAGVGAYDLSLLVVDAQEGVMPQTREHVEILNLLQTPRGIVALTKIDAVDADFLELVQEDLRDFLQGTFLADAPIVPVSAKTGKGLDALKLALQEQLARSPVRDRKSPFRMPVDRAFTKTGFGSVVTGSLWSGSLTKGDRVQILPGELETKVRGLQIHGVESELAVAGQRVAVNLAGIELDSLRRGQVICEPGSLQPTTRLDVRLDVLSKIPRALKHRAKIRFYCGTSEVLGQVFLLEGDQIEPGESALVQLILEEPAVVRHKDRYVLRDFTSCYTIGGGEVLNPLAERHRRRDEGTLDELRQRESGGEEDTILAGLKASSGWKAVVPLAAQLQLPLSHVESVLGRMAESGLVINFGKHWMLATTLADFQEQLTAILTGLQMNAPWKTGWKKEELLKLINSDIPKLAEESLQILLQRGELQLKGKLIALTGHQAKLSAAQESHLKRVCQTLRAAAFQPPTWEQIPASLNIEPSHWKVVENYMLDGQLAVRLAPGMVFLEETLASVPQLLRPLGEFAPSAARDALVTSRKFLIPLLEFLDSRGVTVQKGDLRTVAQ